MNTPLTSTLGSTIISTISGAITGGLFGPGALLAVPVLNTVASLLKVPEATNPQQTALLAQVRTWVAENRGPTDAELDAFKATRDDLDAQLRAGVAAIETGGAGKPGNG